MLDAAAPQRDGEDPGALGSAARDSTPARAFPPDRSRTAPRPPPLGDPPSESLPSGEEEAAPGPAPAAPPVFVPKPPLLAGCYMLASVLVGLTQGLGVNFISANLNQVAGSLGATTTEASWLMAAYMAPNVSLSLLLIKIRMQFGIRNFAEAAILVFVAVSLLHLWADDLPSALAVRFLAGIAAAPMSTLGFLYMLESFPPARKMTVGLCLALANTSLAVPVARLISPHLLDIADLKGLYVAEIALALVSFAAIYLLPLASPPRARVISAPDIVSYLLIAVGFGSAAIVLVMGRLYWWTEAGWIGVLLVVAIGAVTLAAAVELNRRNPLLDIRWLTSREVVHFTAALLVFRVVLSEQSSGASGFFQVLGLSNEQLGTLYGVILATSVLAGLACAAVMRPGREPAIHAVALLLLVAGAWMDSRTTSLTRPEQMYASQALIAAAGALFLPPAVASGLLSALKKGPNYILSFIIVFLTTQSLGGLLGSALFGTFVTVREKFHSHSIVEHLTLANPVVAGRVAQLGAAYNGTQTDPLVRNAEGLALLGGQATREANVLAYNDAFLAIAWLAAFALLCLGVHVLVRVAANRRPPPAPSAVQPS